MKSMIRVFIPVLLLLVLTACGNNNSSINNSLSWSGLSVEGDIAYISNGAEISALKDGELLWRYPQEESRGLAFYAAPAVGEEYIFAGSYDNRLHVISKTNGAQVNVIEIGNNKNKVIASPLLTDKAVIVLSSGGMVSAYSPEAPNEMLWQTVMDGEVWVKPVCVDDRLYVASMDKKLHVLTLEDGVVQKTMDEEISGAIMSDPVLVDKTIYFSTLANEVDGLDTESGDVEVLIHTEGEMWGAPLVMGDRLVAADMAGNLYIQGINENETSIKVPVFADSKIGFIASPVALDENNFVLISEIGDAMIYDLEGKSVKDRNLGARVFSTPVLTDNGSLVIALMDQDFSVKAYTSELKEDWIYVASDEKNRDKGESSETTDDAAEETAAEEKES